MKHVINPINIHRIFSYYGYINGIISSILHNPLPYHFITKHNEMKSEKSLKLYKNSILSTVCGSNRNRVFKLRSIAAIHLKRSSFFSKYTRLHLSFECITGEIL